MFFGLISYPLYLIHWPFISFIKIIEPNLLNNSIKLIVCGISILFASLVYKYIEIPVRNSTGNKVTFFLLFTLILVGLVSFVSYEYNFYPAVIHKFPGAHKVTNVFNEWEYPTEEMQQIDYNGEIFNKIGCGKDIVLFFGDSNIEQYAPRISFLFQNDKSNKAAVFATMGGLCPILHVGRTLKEVSFVENVSHFALLPEVKTIVISSMWLGYLGGSAKNYYYHDVNHLSPLSEEAALAKATLELETMIKNFISHGKEVFIILGIPYGDDYGPKNFFKRNFHGEWDYFMKHALKKEWDDENKNTRDTLIRIARNSGAKILNPEAFLCDGKVCITYDLNGIPIYKDVGHLKFIWIF